MKGDCVRHLLIAAALLGSAACVAAPPVQEAAVPAYPAPTPLFQPVAVAAPVAPPPVQLAAAPAPPPQSPALALSVPTIGLYLPPFTNILPSFVPEALPGRLTLNNFSFDRAQVEAVVTTSPVCNLRAPGEIESDFELPLNGTRIILAPPGSDVCWRRAVQPAPGPPTADSGWSDWNRAYVADGTAVNSKL